MNKILEFKAIIKNAVNDKVKKSYPLRSLNVPDRQYYSLGDSYKKIPLAELKRRFAKVRRTQAIRDLILRYLMQRAAQSCEDAG